MATKTLNISLDEKLIKEIDKAAKAQYSSRSDFLRSAAISQLQALDKGNDLLKFSKEFDEFMETYKQDLKNLAKR